MDQPNQESIQESNEDSIIPNSIQVFLNTVLKIDEAEVVLFSKWMGYNNFTDLCGDFNFELNHINDFSDYRVDGVICALKFGMMNKLWWFISWTSTRIKDITFELYAKHFLALTYEEFNEFR